MAKLGTDAIMSGTAAGRPAASLNGRLYWATDTKVLSRDNGATWDDIGYTNPMSASGDIITGGASGAAGRLAKGSDGDVLTIDAGTHVPAWAALPVTNNYTPLLTGVDLSTVNTTLTSAHCRVLVSVGDNGGGPQLILPAANALAGQIISVQNMDGVNTVTVACQGADTFWDGAATTQTLQLLGAGLGSGYTWQNDGVSKWIHTHFTLI